MSRSHRAFTLLEMLLVIGILVLLISLVLVALGGVRDAGVRVRSLDALRQMMIGYTGYSTENNGRLLPAYIGADLMDDPEDPFYRLRAHYPDGSLIPHDTPDVEDMQSYVWRLAPFVSDDWTVFFAEASKGAIDELKAEVELGQYGPGTGGRVSERPTFGLNSIFVGGDSVHGGTYATDRHPWTGDPDVVPIAATRMSQAKNPTKLIVFGSTAMAALDGGDDTYDDSSQGFCELRAPFLRRVGVVDDETWVEPQWCATPDGVFRTADGAYLDGAGLPIDRTDNGVLPVAHLDASTEGLIFTPPGDLWVISSSGVGDQIHADMTLWSPFQVGQRKAPSDCN